MNVRQTPAGSQGSRPRPRLGLTGAAALTVIAILALALTSGGPDTAAADAEQLAALATQKCVLCGKSFADKLAQLCTACDNGKCFKCGSSFPDKVARICSSCDKGKCINCGKSFPTKAAKLCSRCGN